MQRGAYFHSRPLKFWRECQRRFQYNPNACRGHLFYLHILSPPLWVVLPPTLKLSPPSNAATIVSIPFQFSLIHQPIPSHALKKQYYPNGIDSAKICIAVLKNMVTTNGAMPVLLVRLGCERRSIALS